MQAIITKWIGPTNSRGSRVKAAAEVGSLTIGWDCSKNVEQNHTAAAEAFARKWDWKGAWVGGGTKDGYAFVNVTRAFDAAFTV